MPLPDAIAAELAAIDATLAGDAVDPQFAELAELALLLADARPAIADDVAERLDRRVSGLASAPERHRVPRPRRTWGFRPAVGAGLGVALALVVVVVVLAGRGGGSKSGTRAAGDFAAAPVPAATATTASSAAGSASASSGSPGLAKLAAPPRALLSTQSSAASSQSLVPAPVTNGRHIVQSAQLTLSAPQARIATVAQELFSVVGAEAGIVKHSSVTNGSSGYASFTLSIPTANLSTTLTRLTQLRYAQVSSSTESSTDVNSQYLDDARALTDAKALRTSLLKQLEAAGTTAEIDSLKAQIQDAESTIAADETKVNTLNGRISYTSVGVQINAGAALPGPPKPSDHGFTFHRAAHDALRVLIDVGGGALIALAVLLPLAVLLGLGTWLTLGWRRRGRERALDAA